MNLNLVSRPVVSAGAIALFTTPLLALQSTQFGSQQVITNTATGVVECSPIDRDGDGNHGVVAAVTGANRVTLYGDGNAPGWGSSLLISNFPNTTCVHVADLDGDGDPDVIAGAPGNFPTGSSNALRVFGNNGNGTWTIKVIPQEVPGIWDVTTGDLNGDGQPDIVISLGGFWDQIGWFPNNGNLNFGGVQTVSPGVSTSSEPRNIHTADVDGDGDIDVLAANYNGNDFSWYRNNGNGGSFTRRLINSNAPGARNIRTGDINGDGVLDVVTTSVGDRTVGWHRGTGSGNFATRQVISTANNDARGLHVADLDNDGDLDVLSTSETNNRVDWYENGGNGSFGAQNVITNGAVGAAFVDTLDMDGDGDQDVISVSPGDNKIAWYENQLENSGSAYCFGDGSGTACPCGNNGFPGEGCGNSNTFGGASLTGSGNASLSADTFQLQISGVPGAKPGLVLRGINQVSGGAGNPVGEGLLCAAGQAARSSVKVTSGNGSTTYTEFKPGQSFGATSYGTGTATNYQFWYRDTANTCNGGGFNFTNGWTVTWNN